MTKAESPWGILQDSWGGETVIRIRIRLPELDKDPDQPLKVRMPVMLGPDDLEEVEQHFIWSHEIVVTKCDKFGTILEITKR